MSTLIASSAGARIGCRHCDFCSGGTMRSSALDEYVGLIARSCLEAADEMVNFYCQAVSEPPIGKRLREKFSFMSWTIAQGVWSNIGHQALRRDLQSQLKEAVILLLGRDVGGQPADMAAACARIDEDFRGYVKDYAATMAALPEADLETSIWVGIVAAGATKDEAPQLTVKALKLDGVHVVAELAGKVNNERRRGLAGFARRMFGRA